MTTFVIEHFGPPTSASDERSLRFSRERAADELGGRAVWCAAPLPDVPPPPGSRSPRTMLGGAARAAVELGPAGRGICAESMRDPDPAVRHDDVVLLHDALTALLAQAVRERGAHAVWCANVAAPAPGRLGTREAWQFLSSCTTGVDAYVTRCGSGLVAVMPSADVVAVRADPDREFGWKRALADVIRGDRDETVGGTRHPRPAVAAR